MLNTQETEALEKFLGQFPCEMDVYVAYGRCNTGTLEYNGRITSQDQETGAITFELDDVSVEELLSKTIPVVLNLEWAIQGETTNENKPA